MEKNWTPAQKSVIDTHDKNILVSAAAGAGKTAVLVARIIKMITDKEKPVDIDRLVIITFTRAAAAQMKQKISDELEKMIEAEPENPLYRRQYHLLGNAVISTIDSFCLNIVRAYFQKLELDPSFRMADETELGLIKSDCMDEIMEKYHETGSEDFYYLIEAYCGYKSDEKLTEYIFKLAQKAESMAWPQEWLDSLIKDYEIDDPGQFDASHAAVSVFDHVKGILRNIVKRIDAARALCITDDGAPDYIPTIDDDGDAINSVLNSSGYSELGNKLKAVKFGMLSRKKTGDPEVKEKVKEIRDKYKEDIKTIIKSFYFSDTEEITGLLTLSLPAVKCLVQMTKDYLKLFAERKREKNIIDFSDAEHFALDILWGETPEALELRKQYSEIIIDEYQDSNNVQEFIACAIAGSCSEQPYIFTVGDVKQSIYKFRNACPELFVSKQKKYAEQKENGKLIILDNNFRSREEVLNSTNAVFKHVMHESIGGIDYSDECSLKKGTEKQASQGEESTYKTEVLIISKTLTPDDVEDEDSEDNTEGKRILEARLLSYRIKELIYKERLQIPDEENEGKMRDVRFSDIVILLRTLKDWSSDFMEVLESEGIPVYSDESDGFFKSGEITLVIDFLRILDNPRQDIPFAAVLRSCIGNMTEEELAEVRIAAKEAPTFYDAVMKVFTESCQKNEISGSHENEDRKDSLQYEFLVKVRKFLNLFNELDAFKQTATVSELIEKIYDVTGLYYYYSAMPDGERRKANLDMLPGYAVKFEETGFSGLFGFIRYYEKMKNRELDYGEAGSVSTRNSVCIMSIHKSKGLEFPVVFVAGLGKNFNLEDFKGDIFISSENGIGIKYVDLEKRVKYPSFYHSVIKMRGTEDIIGEEMRLLYVAMTRAKDKLIMIGYSDKPNTGTDYASLFKSKCFMDFVYPVLEEEKEYFKTAVFSPETVIGSFAKITDSVPVSGKTENTLTDTAEKGKEQIFDALKAEITNARDGKYIYAGEEELPVKLSVSDLKHHMIEEEFGENVFHETREFQPGDKTLPDFMKKEEKTSKGTDYGTLVHKCMQFIPTNFEMPAGSSDVRAFLNEMIRKNRLTEEESLQMPVQKFVEFLNSGIYGRIRKADEVKKFYREKQFMILVKASEINQEKYGDNSSEIPVQGVIDAMFIEDGKIVILDYKTDKAEKNVPGEEERLIKLYKTQLDIYAGAAQRLFGLPVKEKLLYSFALGKEIIVE